ncbi:MAG TPA: HEAT repeat domain-containing protein, partial [Longimicrobiales bacterium]|nr:HEAT repeat domain-containing protein [Longimicrobiales bacterium]
PGVCGDGAATIYIRDGAGGRRVTIHGDNWNMSSSKYADEWMPLCNEGPVRIALTVDQNTVTSLRTYVAGEWQPRSGVTDLGRIGAREAADYLLKLAESGSSRISSSAIFAATLADSMQTAQRLLQIARNQDVPRNARRNAVFWLGQEAAEVATAGLREIIDSDDELEVREQAVFALSQRPADESVPALITLIRRDNVDPRIKKKALFWLGQKDDARALALIEEILTRK